MTVSGETLRSISAPDQLDSRLGKVDFVDGVPGPGTSELVYDHLDFVHGLNAYLNGFPGASTCSRTPRRTPSPSFSPSRQARSSPCSRKR
jgi:hypothetical protein